MTLVIIAGGAIALLIIIFGLAIEARSKQDDDEHPLYSPEDAQAMGMVGTESESGRGYLTGVVMGGIFFVIGAAVLAFGIHRQTEISDIDTWPRVEATIDRTWVKYNSSSEDSDYGAMVSYTYWFEDVQYSGEYSAGRKGSRTRAQRILDDNYAIGDSLTVYVDPDHPDRSEHDPSAAKGSALLMIVFGALFGAVGLLVAVGMLFQKS